MDGFENINGDRAVLAAISRKTPEAASGPEKLVTFAHNEMMILNMKK